MKALLTLCASCVFGAQLFAQIDIGPAPGRLIDVGGRRLHVNCIGTGSPTVVLEAGASSFALDLFLVQSEIARTNRVCSYDRAGSGWSDARTDVETPARIIDDLHAALAAVGAKPPFVLVGHSAGGLYVRLYQLAHPSEVIGLVLIDPSTEDRLFAMYEQRAVPIASLTPEQLRTTLPRSGVVAITPRQPQTGAPFDRLPSDLYELRIKLEQRLIASFPASVAADIVQEAAEGQRAALARLRESRADESNPMRNVPVVVLTRGQEMPRGLAESHAALARLSSNSQHQVVPDAGHEIHLFTPAEVIRAIRHVASANASK